MAIDKTRRTCSRWALAAAAAAGLAAQSATPREQAIDYLNGVAHNHLEARARAVAAIHTRREAELRRTVVRQKIVALIGGL